MESNASHEIEPTSEELALIFLFVDRMCSHPTGYVGYHYIILCAFYWNIFFFQIFRCRAEHNIIHNVNLYANLTFFVIVISMHYWLLKQTDG